MNNKILTYSGLIEAFNNIGVKVSEIEYVEVPSDVDDFVNALNNASIATKQHSIQFD
jgi:hypothetical protein